MLRPSSFIPYQPKSRPKTARGAADYLNAHDQIAAILPTVTRIAALQKDCANALPSIFDLCTVLILESGQLTISTPNAALATKLKQQLPKLQDALLKRGWQVNAIRLKVQVSPPLEKLTVAKQIKLPRQAISALADLTLTLENSPRNDALKSAVSAMLRRHRKTE